MGARKEDMDFGREVKMKIEEFEDLITDFIQENVYPRGEELDYSKKYKENFSEIKELLWDNTFWSPSYFLATTGQVTLDQLKKYVEGQGKNATNTKD